MALDLSDGPYGPQPRPTDYTSQDERTKDCERGELKMKIPEHRRASAYYILITLAFVLLFIVTSYQYKLTDRMFPLLVGYVALPLLILDLLALTDSKIGEKISTPCPSCAKSILLIRTFHKPIMQT